MTSYSPFELHFGNVVVPVADRIGEEGQGFSLADDFLVKARILYGAGPIGIARMALGIAISWVKQRETFGDKLSERQAIQWMVADSEMELRAARLLIYQAAWNADLGRDTRVDASACKVYATETAFRVVNRCVQILGGLGLAKEMPLERWFRDLRVKLLGEGASEIERIVIARHLFKYGILKPINGFTVPLNDIDKGSYGAWSFRVSCHPMRKPAMTSLPNAQLTHVGLFVRNLKLMTDFYCHTLGMVVTDSGPFGNRELAFLSRSPDEHHQLVMIHDPALKGGMSALSQISFRLENLEALRTFYAFLSAEKAPDLEGRNHGNSWSLYFFDPERNKIEIYVPTPWQLSQPWRAPLNLTQLPIFDHLLYRSETRIPDIIAVRQAVYRQSGMQQTMGHILCLQDPEIRPRNLISEDEWRGIAAPALVIGSLADKDEARMRMPVRRPGASLEPPGRSQGDNAVAAQTHNCAQRL